MERRLKTDIVSGMAIGLIGLALCLKVFELTRFGDCVDPSEYIDSSWIAGEIAFIALLFCCCLYACLFQSIIGVCVCMFGAICGAGVSLLLQKSTWIQRMVVLAIVVNVVLFSYSALLAINGRNVPGYKIVARTLGLR